MVKGSTEGLIDKYRDLWDLVIIGAAIAATGEYINNKQIQALGTQICIEALMAISINEITEILGKQETSDRV